jgi:isopentenyl-diphosphate Delta-isomerase
VCTSGGYSADPAVRLADAADIGHSGRVSDTPAPPEQVVLLDDDGNPIGVADKATVHGPTTPRHLAFSCYGFDQAGRLLVTRRSRQKLTFPGVVTNTCCGHPGPGEAIEDAVRRRLADELGLTATDLRLVLPDFSYRASDGGVEENELCPVYVGTLAGELRPRPDEVESAEWWAWEEFLAAAAAGELSPWARLQAPLLDARRAEWGRVPA